MPHLCEFYPGICLTTDEKALENRSQVKKNFSQCTVYILPKLPYITKPSHTRTHTHTHTHKHTNTQTQKQKNTHTNTKTQKHTQTHTSQNNIKPPQYKLKQTQYKIYPNETVTI